MGVNVNKDDFGSRIMTTENLKKNKLCHGCQERFVVVERGPDGKWYCYDCLGIEEPLIEYDSD